MMNIRFWGTRESIPSPGKPTVKYGENTPCVEVRVGKQLLIFNAGTGIRDLGNRLLNE
jgi:phosphoribosyl 1,2-cyclic phosphodiesterase